MAKQRVKEGTRGQDKPGVVRVLADERVYEYRVQLRGGNRLPNVWIKRGRWKRVKKTNFDDRARAAVHLASAKILATEAAPDEPTLAWMTTVDRNAGRDLAQTESRERAGSRTGRRHRRPRAMSLVQRATP
jgi:hypothetical protein